MDTHLIDDQNVLWLYDVLADQHGQYGLCDVVGGIRCGNKETDPRGPELQVCVVQGSGVRIRGYMMGETPTP